MKLIAISSRITGFRSVRFNDDFSIILGESKSRSEGKSHNLGKSCLVKLIDHLLFGSRDSEIIKEIKNNFNNPIFAIELLIDDIRRSVVIDYTTKKKPVFPKEIKQEYEYFIRYQDDFGDEFRKQSMRGKDATWKPLLLRLLGFNEHLLSSKYDIETTIASYETYIKIANEAGIKKDSQKDIVSQLESSKAAIVQAISELDIGSLDKLNVGQLSTEVDTQALALKQKLYFQRRELSQIDLALKNTDLLEANTERVEKLFAEMNVYFEGQIVNDLKSVKAFNNAITNNRRSALSSIKKDLLVSIAESDSQHAVLEKRQKELLRSVLSTNTIEQYKDLSFQLANVEKELGMLQRDVYKESIQSAESELANLRTSQLEAAAKLARHLDEDKAKFTSIASIYRDFMQSVMNIDAELSILKNSTGNVVFDTVAWRNGSKTNELNGDMAKRISCAAFDIALRASLSEDKGFVIHDGVIDGADSNTKAKFIGKVKSMAKEYSFQYVLTAIKEDLPSDITEKDIVINLNDITAEGLLFGRFF